MLRNALRKRVRSPDRDGLLRRSDQPLCDNPQDCVAGNNNAPRDTRCGPQQFLDLLVTVDPLQAV